MGKNIITKTLTGSGSFTVPSGVTQISVSPGLTRSAFIAGGAMAIAPSGQAYAWGQNSWGQIGDGTIVPKSSPVATVAGYSFLKISAVGSYFLGLLPSGQVYGWGQNTTGQLGDGTILNRSAPVAVIGGYSFVDICAGQNYSFGLTASGQAYAWGYNQTYGSLGDGTLVNKSSPVQVLGGYSFVSIAAGGGQSLGLTASGQVYGWGYNFYGSIGDGTTVSKSSPVAIVGGYSFVSIAAGSSHTVALTASGQAYAWGYNTDGQLGDGTTLHRSSPVAVVGGYSFVSIAAGSNHTLGLTASGQIYAWGYNGASSFAGALGDGTVLPKSSPVLVVGGYLFKNISAFQSNSYAVDRSGRIYAWGQNATGQLGDGTVIPKSSPVAVVGGYNFCENTPPNIHSILSVVPGQVIGYKTGAAANYFGSALITTDCTEIIIRYFM